MSNEPVSEQYRVLAEEWCDAESAASLLEDTKSAILSQMILEVGGTAINRAEAQVKAAPRWIDHLEKINRARTHANKLKVRLEYLKMKFWENQSGEASKRAEMRL